MTSTHPSKRAIRKHRTRATILNAAQLEFALLGYDAACLRDVIRRSGLAVGTFYQHFRTKEDIRDALVDEAVVVLKEKVSAQRTARLDFEGFLRALVSCYLELHVEQKLKPASLGTDPTCTAASPFNALGEGLHRELRSAILAELGGTESIRLRSHANFASSMAVGIVNDVGLPILQQGIERREMVADLVCDMIRKASRFGRAGEIPHRPAY